MPWDTRLLPANASNKGLLVAVPAQVAPMPTASTSQILGNNECFEPYTSNIYVRRVLSGALLRCCRAVLIRSKARRHVIALPVLVVQASLSS